MLPPPATTEARFTRNVTSLTLPVVIMAKEPPSIERIGLVGLHLSPNLALGSVAAAQIPHSAALVQAAEWPIPALAAVPALASPDNWHGADLENAPEKWVNKLSDSIIRELEASFKAFEATGTPLARLSRDTFKLGPETTALFSRIKTQLFEGIGFALLRGLPVDKWSREQTAAVTLGIGVNMGSLMIQNKRGHLLGHVKDLGRDPSDPTVRYYATHERQRFHTDGGLRVPRLD